MLLPQVVLLVCGRAYISCYCRILFEYYLYVAYEQPYDLCTVLLIIVSVWLHTRTIAYRNLPTIGKAVQLDYLPSEGSQQTTRTVHVPEVVLFEYSTSTPDNT